MRRNIEEVVCDRCGKKMIGEECRESKFIGVQIRDEQKITDHCYIYIYRDLCPRCARTVARRIEEAGPLKNAPMWKGEGDAT